MIREKKKRKYERFNSKPDAQGLGTDELFNYYNLGTSMQSTVLDLTNGIDDTLPNVKIHCLTLLVAITIVVQSVIHE